MIANKQINKHINFVPEFMVAEKEQVHRIIVIVIVTIIFTLLSFGIYYFPEIKLVSLDSQLDSTNTAIQLLGEAKQLKAKYDETLTRLQKKKTIIDEISKTQVDVIFIMNKLIASAPKNVTLSYFSASSRENIIASYVVNSPIEAADLVANLKKSDIFENVEMPTIPIADKKVDISFKLKLKPGVEAKEAVKEVQSNTTAADQKSGASENKASSVKSGTTTSGNTKTSSTKSSKQSTQTSTSAKSGTASQTSTKAASDTKTSTADTTGSTSAGTDNSNGTGTKTGTNN